ncbi:winged helix-turn-helix domain-containing protein [Streptomyces sp. NPDC058296]|uniref:AfsR/SARP family transcriptional regulator n=1 Tax=Streptomyces sp. NPDC058296 TaxID=3346432 RepID=UPI0036E346A4
MYAGAQFSVLDPVRLHRQGGEAGTGQPRQCAVLASLLLRAGKPVSLSKLVEDVWGDDARPSAVRSERTYVYRLRQALGEQNDRSVSLVDGGHLPRIQPDALDRNRSKETTAMARETRSIGDLSSAASPLTESLEMWKGVTLAGAQGRSRASSAASARCVPRRRRGRPLPPRNCRNDGTPAGTVMSRIRRGCQQLRQLLPQYTPGLCTA